MCEIMTIIAAVVCTSIFFVQKKSGKTDRSVFLGMLMFWGASLMWLIDCIFSAAGGEGFFDISMEDTILGIIILAAGLCAMYVRKIAAKKIR